MITQNSCKPCITQKTKKNSATFYDPYSRQYRVTNKLNVWFLIDAMYLWPSDVHWGKHSVWVNMTWCGLQTHNQTKILVRSVETHNCQHSGFILLGTLCWSSVIASRLSLFTFLFLSSNLSCKAERKSQDVKSRCSASDLQHHREETGDRIVIQCQYVPSETHWFLNLRDLYMCYMWYITPLVVLKGTAGWLWDVMYIPNIFIIIFVFNLLWGTCFW